MPSRVAHVAPALDTNAVAIDRGLMHGADSEPTSTTNQQVTLHLTKPPPDVPFSPRSRPDRIWRVHTEDLVAARIWKNNPKRVASVRRLADSARIWWLPFLGGWITVTTVVWVQRWELWIFPFVVMTPYLLVACLCFHVGILKRLLRSFIWWFKAINAAMASLSCLMLYYDEKPVWAVFTASFLFSVGLMFSSLDAWITRKDFKAIHSCIMLCFVGGLWISWAFRIGVPASFDEAGFYLGDALWTWRSIGRTSISNFGLFCLRQFLALVGNRKKRHQDDDPDNDEGEDTEKFALRCTALVDPIRTEMSWRYKPKNKKPSTRQQSN